MYVSMFDLESNKMIISIKCYNVNDGIKGIRNYLNNPDLADSCDDNPIILEYQHDGEMHLQHIADAIHVDTHYILEYY